jgi:signal peptidase II
VTKRLFRFLLLALATLGADLASKAWAVRTLGPDSRPFVLIAHRLNFVLAYNPNGAMGMLHDVPATARRAIFVAVSLLAALTIAELARRSRPNQATLRVGLALLLGGALGNLVDRIRAGVVVDFIDVIYARTGGLERHWHTFNVADAAICIGALLLAFDAFRAKKPVPLALHTFQR